GPRHATISRPPSLPGGGVSVRAVPLGQLAGEGGRFEGRERLRVPSTRGQKSASGGMGDAVWSPEGRRRLNRDDRLIRNAPTTPRPSAIKSVAVHVAAVTGRTAASLRPAVCEESPQDWQCVPAGDGNSPANAPLGGGCGRGC